ncbi:MAG: (d)CMP kinase [Acidobacteriota bacterium]|nr:(d)CMP kinase [Acidobacteriota bacterium]
MSDRKPIIAIDGPAGAGKSTIAKTLARQLGYLFINTGAMYRAVAWKALQLGTSLDDANRVGKLAEGSLIELTGTVDAMRVLIDGRDITEDIVTPTISQAASVVSAIPAVRRALVARQQQMGKAGGVVMEGRDIATQVFPDAEIKIYLDASAEARAERRHTDDLAKGINTGSLLITQAEIEERDTRDKSRADSPLVQADGAVYIDSSAMTINEVVEKILSLVSQQSRGN